MFEILDKKKEGNSRNIPEVFCSKLHKRELFKFNNTTQIKAIRNIQQQKNYQYRVTKIYVKEKQKNDWKIQNNYIGKLVEVCVKFY